MEKLTELRCKEVINVRNGERLGFIGDLRIECRSGKVVDLIVPTGSPLPFFKQDEYVMAKVIDIDKEHKQLRLSFKALSSNTRRYTKRVKFQGMPESIKGFGTIRDNMSKWIKGEYDD